MTYVIKVDFCMLVLEVCQSCTMSNRAYDELESSMRHLQPPVPDVPWLMHRCELLGRHSQNVLFWNYSGLSL